MKWAIQPPLSAKFLDDRLVFQSRVRQERRNRVGRQSIGDDENDERDAEDGRDGEENAPHQVSVDEHGRTLGRGKGGGAPRAAAPRKRLGLLGYRKFSYVDEAPEGVHHGALQAGNKGGLLRGLQVGYPGATFLPELLNLVI